MIISHLFCCGDGGGCCCSDDGVAGDGGVDIAVLVVVCVV